MFTLDSAVSFSGANAAHVRLPFSFKRVSLVIRGDRYTKSNRTTLEEGRFSIFYEDIVNVYTRARVPFIQCRRISIVSKVRF